MSGSYIQDLTAGALLEEETKLWLELQAKHGVVAVSDLLDHLPARSETTVKRYDAVIKKRLSGLSDEAIFILNSSHGDSFKQILLLLVMNRTEIVTDFIKQVYCEAKRSYQDELTAVQISLFIDQKTDLISNFKIPSESTLKKVKTNLIKVLVNAQLLENSKNMKLQSIFLLQDVYDFASEHELTHLVNILECRG